MSKRIEDYGLIGNTITAALVALDGSIDWLCLPRFDGDACFAALLGGPNFGFWQIRPATATQRVERRYVAETAILETTFVTAEGRVTVTDFMPFTADERYVDLVRIVRGNEGRVPMMVEIKFRFGYGRIVPWVTAHDYGLSAVAGPDALRLYTPVELSGHDHTTTSEFVVDAGEIVPFTLAYHPSHRAAHDQRDVLERLDETSERWQAWSGRCRHDHAEGHPWREAVMRSLITLKALTFGPTGGMVAAPTTSLPEHIGGTRNWDYRYCWIRDATLALFSLLESGYREEALGWCNWLLRATAGEPGQLQIIYGLSGERRLTEIELPWLPGYEESRPVRIGNAAFDQRQLDVPGELMDMLHVGRQFELGFGKHEWDLQLAVLARLEEQWDEPDSGIWEVRGGRFHFTFSRLMCWVAFDRAIQAVENFGASGPVERWRALRERIRADIETYGWSDEKNSFVQAYGGTALDASLLLIAELGFLPPEDPRFAGTVLAVERELLLDDGIVLRYRTDETPDGLPEGEGAFIACGFWLADAYVLLDRHDDAVAQFERLLALRNDLGLLAEEYDTEAGRLLGNFPQGFSHIALVNTAKNLASALGPARRRAAGCQQSGSVVSPVAQPGAGQPGKPDSVPKIAAPADKNCGR